MACRSRLENRLRDIIDSRSNRRTVSLPVRALVLISGVVVVSLVAAARPTTPAGSEDWLARWELNADKSPVSDSHDRCLGSFTWKLEFIAGGLKRTVHKIGGNPG